MIGGFQIQCKISIPLPCLPEISPQKKNEIHDYLKQQMDFFFENNLNNFSLNNFAKTIEQIAYLTEKNGFLSLLKSHVLLIFQ